MCSGGEYHFSCSASLFFVTPPTRDASHAKRREGRCEFVDSRARDDHAHIDAGFCRLDDDNPRVVVQREIVLENMYVIRQAILTRQERSCFATVSMLARDLLI